jgi:hypothetical protein
MLECCFLQRIHSEFYGSLLFGYCDLKLMWRILKIVVCQLSIESSWNQLPNRFETSELFLENQGFLSFIKPGILMVDFWRCLAEKQNPEYYALPADYSMNMALMWERGLPLFDTGSDQTVKDVNGSNYCTNQN